MDNTFIRGPSPSYSEDVMSENCLSGTLPIGGDHPSGGSENYLTNKMSSNEQRQIYLKSIKGRNTFAFWTIVGLLLILTVGNLILTMTIIGVLKMGKGMQSIELIPEEDVVKFFGSTDFDKIYNKFGGQIDGFIDEPVTITSDDSSVMIKINRNGQAHSRMILDETGINVKGVNTFDIKEPLSGDILFSTHRPHYNLPEGVDNLKVKSIGGSRITSPIGKPLLIESDYKIAVKGSEGINMNADNIFIQFEDINANSTHATQISAGSGVFLDMDNIPIINTEFGVRAGNIQYKICVCMPQGNLYRIPIPRIHNGAKISCTHFNPKHDPCV